MTDLNDTPPADYTGPTPAVEAAGRAVPTHDFQRDIDLIGENPAVPTILETVCLVTGMGFAAVARVTDSRWITCRAVDHLDFGLAAGDELDVESTLCHEVRQSEHEIVISDVRADAIYCDHHTPAQYGFRSYISVPIRRVDGSFFGTLCALDPVPRHMHDKRILDMFRLFAQTIGNSLESEERLKDAEEQLERERDLGRLQDELVAILGHDLRNPVASIRAGLRMLSRRTLDEQSVDLVGQLRTSAHRMSALIENILDHARMRIGAGLAINRDDCMRLGEILQHVVSEIRAVSPERRFDVDIEIEGTVSCDQDRLGQLLSNLLGNAVAYGAPGGVIWVRAQTKNDALEISVANDGKPIPIETQKWLFEPFARGDATSHGGGLGLGLHIASQIAKGHGGRINVISTPERTEFVFQMPLHTD